MNQKIIFTILNFLYSATYVIAMNNQCNMHQDDFMYEPRYFQYKYVIPTDLRNDVLILNNIKFDRKTGAAYINHDKVQEFNTCPSVFNVFFDKTKAPWITKNFTSKHSTEQRSAPLENNAEISALLKKIIVIPKQKSK